MSEVQAKKSPAGTLWIVVGALLLAIGALHLVTAPAVIATGDGAAIAGKIVGVLLFVGLGVWLLIVGLNQRRQHS